MPGVRSPLAGRGVDDIDYYIVRENTEGEYSSVGGRIFEGTERETVVQQAIFTRHGTDRIMRFAFELAAKRKRHVTSATSLRATEAAELDWLMGPCPRRVVWSGR
jgi:tartrate dehydrogenase/decarboxylase / D-malate dehydrogenase